MPYRPDANYASLSRRQIDDAETEKLSAEIARRIQDELTYPGQVKITVIRETRSVSFAK